MKKLYVFACFLFVAVLTAYLILPDYLAASQNRVEPQPAVVVSEHAAELHRQLQIVDWHADTLLWKRSPLESVNHSHVDLPRLQQGNVALQVFSIVSKVPYGRNYVETAEAWDMITPITVIQGWPMQTWNSLLQRALYQARKLQQAAAASNGQLQLIGNQQQLSAFLQMRSEQPQLVGAVLAAEGAQILEGDLANLDLLYENGLRVVGLQHFFDNRLGGSLHGTSKQGLTDFGRRAVKALEDKQMIIDLAHSSEQVVRDVLEIATRPIVVSHTGLRGTCDSSRNLPDELMQQIAAKDGLIAIGYWDGAVCDISPAGVAKSLFYGVNLLGEDHVALGSDFDGTITAAFDTSQLSLLTQALLDQGLSEAQIHKVMGENSLRFLQQNLPAN